MDLDNVDDLDISNTVVEKIVSHQVATIKNLHEYIDYYVKQNLSRKEWKKVPRVSCHFLTLNREQVLQRLDGITKKISSEDGAELFSSPVDVEYVL